MEKNLVLRSSMSFFRLDKINLDYLGKKLEGSQYIENVNNISTLVVNNKEPSIKYIIYKDGRVLCMGAKSKKEILESSDILINKIRGVGLKVNLVSKPKIVNLVATYKLGKSVNLNKFASENACVDYNPEQFPGAIFRIGESESNIEKKSIALIFGSGKIVFTGFKKYKDFKLAIKIMKRVLI